MFEGYVTRTTVIRKACAGDFSDFARIYAPLVHAMLIAQRCTPARAEEEGQELWVKLMTRVMPRYEHDARRGGFRRYLWTVIRNHLVDQWRRRKREPELLVEEQIAVVDAELERAFDREWIRVHLVAALERVRERVEETTFRAFELMVLDELSAAEAAARLGLERPNTASVYKARVLRHLRDELERFEDEP